MSFRSRCFGVVNFTVKKIVVPQVGTIMHNMGPPMIMINSNMVCMCVQSFSIDKNKFLLDVDTVTLERAVESRRYVCDRFSVTVFVPNSSDSPKVKITPFKVVDLCLWNLVKVDPFFDTSSVFRVVVL